MSGSASMLFLISSVLFVAFCLLRLSDASSENEGKIAAWRDQEKSALNSLSIDCSDDRYVLRGHEATVVSREESFGYVADGNVVVSMSSKTFLLNPSGEYFYWLWYSQSRPFIKHVTHANAKIALGEKYIAPENR